MMVSSSRSAAPTVGTLSLGEEIKFNFARLVSYQNVIVDANLDVAVLRLEVLQLDPALVPSLLGALRVQPRGHMAKYLRRVIFVGYGNEEADHDEFHTSFQCTNPPVCSSAPSSPAWWAPLAGSPRIS